MSTQAPKPPRDEKSVELQAERDLIRRQARAGDPVCAGLLRLQALAGSHGSTAFMAGTGVDYADEEEE